jgi:putative DNA primase/helicase
MQSEIERAMNALNAIPSDLPRDEWVKVGMAFHAARGNFEEFDSWSAQADCYQERACRDTWKSFKSVEGGITAASLYALARGYGWKDPGSRKSLNGTHEPTTASRKQPADANAVWERCGPATNTHPYILEKKAAGIPLDDLRVLPSNDLLRIAGESMAGSLVVPVRTSDGALSTLQFIAPPEVAERLKAQGKPGKLNLPNTRVDGWHAVGDVATASVIYICEGIGAAWACWQATGAAAVVCFGWGRVAAVSAQLRKLKATVQIVLVPDAGKEEAAAKIAKTVSGLIVTMPGGWEENSDVSDLAQSQGMDVLEALLHDATEPPRPPPLLKPVSVSDVLTNPASPPQFVWDGYVPRGVVSLLGAHGGTGKSTIALMLSVCAALGKPLFGVNTVQCKTLFVSLEDNVDVVRHRLAFICRKWGIDPSQLHNNLHIVDGTENPELFSAESRDAGEKTPTYFELRQVVQAEDVGLVVVDNASDAYGGDEIQRRQVRAFIRALVEIARLTNCGVMLLAHVDKNTSRARRPEGGEGYSGSTAWHNSVRSRLFMTRKENGTLILEHQKSNLGRCCQPLELDWLNGGLPQLAGTALSDHDFDPHVQRAEGRVEDGRAIKVLRMIDEFESREQYCSTAPTARNNVFSMLKSEPMFQKLKLNADGCKRIVNQCQRANWIAKVEYRTHDRKTRPRWTLTKEGRAIAGLTTPCAPCAPCTPFTNENAESAGGAPCAPSCVGGMGEESTHSGGVNEKSPGVENAKLGDRLRSTEAAVVQIPTVPDDDIHEWLSDKKIPKFTAHHTIRYP